MKISVDFSMFVNDELSVGHVHGELDVSSLPPIGSMILFGSTPPPSKLSIPYPTFQSQLKVEHLLVRAQRPDVPVMVMLEDFVAPSIEAAKAAIAYFERGFGLCGDAIGPDFED